MFMGLAKLRVTQPASDPVTPAPARDLQDRLLRAVQGPAPNAFLARFVVLNLIGAALFGWGLICCLRKDWQSVRWAGNALVYLGMVGTVLGLIITVSDLSVDKQGFDDFKQVISSIYVGSATALYTNLLACIGYLWLGTNAHFLARQEV